MGFHTAAQEPAGEVAMVPAVVVLLAALRRSRARFLSSGYQAFSKTIVCMLL